MDDFERTEFSDSYYAVLGRALVIATRFDSGARTLAMFLDIKANPKSLLSDDTLSQITEKARKRRLFDNLDRIGIRDQPLGELLKDAREARNFIAHEACIGVDALWDRRKESDIAAFVAFLSEKVRCVADGDFVINALSSAASGECVPHRQQWRNYSAKIVRWVCEI